ncbi:hypothetical protein PSPO01_13473 [Paraphaeosphaeria sporulosa]
MIFPSASSVLLAAPPFRPPLRHRIRLQKVLLDPFAPLTCPHHHPHASHRRHHSPRVPNPLSQLYTPLQYPPAECGYSVNSHVRLAQHRAHKSSNYVMNLVEDICAYLYRSDTFSQLFTMQPFIVALLFRPEQAAVVEIFLSGLLQVWVDEGGGLNAYPAGRSVANPWRVGGAQWVKEN